MLYVYLEAGALIVKARACPSCAPAAGGSEAAGAEGGEVQPQHQAAGPEVHPLPRRG